MLNRVLKDSFALLFSSVFSRVASVVASFVILKELGPAKFGVFQIINYLPSMMGAININLSGVLLREAPPLINSGDSDKLEKIKNVAISSDVIVLLCLSASVFAASFNYAGEIRYCIWIAAVNFFLSGIINIHWVMCSIDRKFKEIAISTAFTGLINTVFVVSTIYFLGIYSPLLAICLSSLSTLFLYSRYIKIRFKWSFRGELFRLLSVAFPLLLGGVAFGAFGAIERAQAAQLLSSTQLGIYTFLIYIYELGLIAVMAFIQAISTDIYAEFGKNSDGSASEKIVLMPMRVLSYVYPIGGTIFILFAPLIIKNFLPKYIEAVPMLQHVAIMVTVISISVTPRVLMNSTGYNMQMHNMSMWIMADLLMYVGSIIIINKGLGLIELIECRTVVIAIVFLMTYAITAKKLFGTIKGMLSYVMTLLIPVSFAFLVINTSNLYFSNSYSLFDSVVKFSLFCVLYAPLLYYIDRNNGYLKKILSKRVPALVS